MTTIITVKNEGPDELLIRYYDEAREIKAEKTRLAVGESIEITVWDGHLPVMWPIGHSMIEGADGWFHSVPQAHM